MTTPRTTAPQPDPPHDDDYDEMDDEDCPNCGGEGWLYECLDGFCEDAEEGCDQCMYRCDWCNSRKPKPAEQEPAP